MRKEKGSSDLKSLSVRGFGDFNWSAQGGLETVDMVVLGRNPG